MALENNFFAEFPPVSKEEWLRQIAKDLKGRSLEELDWQVEGNLKVSPFAHADDFATPSVPLYGEPNNWEICEEVFATDAVAANRQALEMLEGGAESLCFNLSTSPDAAFFEQLFDNIHLDFIGLHFTGPGMAQNPGNVLGHLERLSNQKNIQTQRLRGSLGYDPAASAGIVDWRYLVDLAGYTREKFPGFKLVTVGLDPHAVSTPPPAPPPNGRGDVEGAASPLPFGGGAGGGVDTGAVLALGLIRGNLYLQKLTERGLSTAEAAGTIQFSMTVGKSYFLEIAKIRAFKLLWLNVLKGWGAPLHLPVVETRFQTEAYTDELYTNMIRATTMAMSAVLGGGDRLTVLPYDAGREAQASYSPAFSRHIARNVQHLLKMESFFSEIPDPAAGSYYIEQLTQQLAERAWVAFQEA